jgi:ubiquinone/menaquinone biosynthesis C-methylase UbiE
MRGSLAVDALPSGDSNKFCHMGIELECPRCRADMNGIRCKECSFELRISDGIMHALPPERTAYYAQFIADYEHIRAAEGRGSHNKDFYLALPYKDLSGNNSKQWHIRSRSYDYLIQHALMPFSQHGTVLDLGAGNCWMSFRLALNGYAPVAVDLLTNNNDGLGAATHYNQHLSNQIPRFQAEATHLPFRDEQFDVIIFNASFHYSEDYEMTLREAFRCLKSSGLVIISDTPWYSKEETGKQMVVERQIAFLKRFGTPSNSMNSLEYLTDERLTMLEKNLGIKWEKHSPWYGFKWAMRPWIAKLCKRREPSRFQIYAAKKHV